MAERLKLEPLTGLRGVAACSVLVAHAADEAFKYGNDAIFHPVMQGLAFFGMSLFFVLSGFVIEYNYGASFAGGPLGTACRRFFVARFARLYPLYLLGVLVFFQYIPNPNFHALTSVSYLTLTQSWFNAEMATFAPAWSISTEWFFYFAFVPLALLLARLRAPALALVAFCVLAAAALILIFRFWTLPLTAVTNHWFWHNDRVSADASAWLHYYSPFVRLPEFIAGVLAAKVFATTKRAGAAPPAVLFGTALALAWCGFAIIVVPRLPNAALQSIEPNFIFAPAIALLMLNLCRYDGLSSRALASRPAVFLGEISYSTYIWSFAAITLTAPYYRSLAQTPGAYANSAIKLALTIVLTIVFAFGSYTLIETPARRLIRKSFEGR